MEKAYKNIGYIFILLLAFVIWGFFKSYFSLLPSSESIPGIYHFHGFVLLAWLVLLIVQPFLIKYKKYAWHRMLGKVSYLLAPLIVISIFLVSKEKYNRLDNYISAEDNIGMIALNIPGMLYFGLLYLLAMINRKKQAYHMRYMIATALFVIGPAIGRALEMYADVSFDNSVLYSVVCIELITVCLIVMDWYNKASYKPFIVTLLFLVAFHLTWVFKFTAVWQYIGAFIAKHFF